MMDAIREAMASHGSNADYWMHKGLRIMKTYIPEVGTVCEYTRPAKHTWFPCIIKGMTGNVIWFKEKSGRYLKGNLNDFQFREVSS